MAKFKVGDKVRLLNGGGYYPLHGFKNGEVYKVAGKTSDTFSEDTRKRIKIKVNDYKGYALPENLELIESKPTKNQRITALEKEIAELRYFKELAQEMEDNSFHDLERIREIEGCLEYLEHKDQHIKAFENRLEHLEQAAKQYFVVPGEPSTVNEVSNIYRRLVVKNVKQLPEAEKLVQEKGLTREDMELILSTFKLRDEKSPQVAGTTSEDKQMTIQEAIKLAMEKDEFITRNNKNFEYFRIKPTNTKDCFLVFPSKEYAEKTGKDLLCKRWNPKAEDILANDWIVTSC